MACLGYGLGIGGSALFFTLGSRTTNLAGLHLYWQAAAATAAAVMFIMGLVSLVVLRDILKREAAIILGS